MQVIIAVIIIQSMTFYHRGECFVLFWKSGFVSRFEDQLEEYWSLWSLAEMDGLLTPS